MNTGRLKLSNGFAASCSYRVLSAEGGELQLASALYLSLDKDDEDDATLFFVDGSKHPVRVRRGDEGTASFTFR